MNNRTGLLGNMPIGVKNLLIINIIVFILSYIVRSRFSVVLEDWLALFCVQSKDFGIWQYLTYQFMHANFEHIFFNMFALVVFGPVLEQYWGTQKFIFYYLACGVGAGILNSLIGTIAVHRMQEAVNLYAQNPDPDAFIQLCQSTFKGRFNPEAAAQFVNQWKDSSSATMAEQSIVLAQQLVDFRANIPTVGASGSIYALLLAFGMLFPNEKIYVYFLIPMKAKWFVILYGGIELFEGIFRTNDHIAHFAHLGGMLFGIILILYWRKQSLNRWN